MQHGKQVKRSILEVCKGAILERCDYELERILANLSDPNVSSSKPRKLTLELVFVPSAEANKIFMKSQVKSKVEPTKPIETTLFNYQEVNQDTGESYTVLREAMDVAPGQINLDGVIAEPEVVVIGYNAKA